MTDDTLKETQLARWHDQHEAEMVPFAGWRMPVQYKTKIMAEHEKVRTDAGWFDVSHMGRFILTGDNVLEFLQYYTTNNVAKLEEGRAQYSFLMESIEGTPAAVDDIYLYMLGDKKYMMVVNAANTGDAWAHLREKSSKYCVSLEDITNDLCLIAVQGSRSQDVLQELCESPYELPEKANRFTHIPAVNGHRIMIAKTGYTGEHNRFEAFVPSDYAETFVNFLAAQGVSPIGLGARNTLRIEAALLLFGHDIGGPVMNHGVINPVQAGMGFAVKTDKPHDMLGRETYELLFSDLKYGNSDVNFTLFEVNSRQNLEPEHEGDPTSQIFHNGQHVGEISSSTAAPIIHITEEGVVYKENGRPQTTLRGLAIGYTTTPLAPGAKVEIARRTLSQELEGEGIEAIVMEKFVDKSSKGALMIAGRPHLRIASHYHPDLVPKF